MSSAALSKAQFVRMAARLAGVPERVQLGRGAHVDGGLASLSALQSKGFDFSTMKDGTVAIGEASKMLKGTPELFGHWTPQGGMQVAGAQSENMIPAGYGPGGWFNDPHAPMTQSVDAAGRPCWAPGAEFAKDEAARSEENRDRLAKLSAATQAAEDAWHEHERILKAAPNEYAALDISRRNRNAAIKRLRRLQAGVDDDNGAYESIGVSRGANADVVALRARDVIERERSISEEANGRLEQLDAANALLREENARLRNRESLALHALKEAKDPTTARGDNDRAE